jgi:hypothetical protein
MSRIVLRHFPPGITDEQIKEELAKYEELIEICDISRNRFFAKYDFQ